MSHRKNKTHHSAHKASENTDGKDKFGMDPNFCSDHPGEAEDEFQDLSTSDYSKVIFCDLYYNDDNTVGCRFEITDDVKEDPFDYVGLFKVGFVHLSQCLASKLLSNCDCEEDGKLIRCTFKPRELPALDSGFYQFLYVTTGREVCGASMPFEIKNPMPKDVDDDIIAECSEDDFLVVRSTMAEKNRRLQSLLDELTEKCLSHESAMNRVQFQLKIVTEEKMKLEHSLKQACEEKLKLINESQRIAQEKDVVCREKEEAIRILREKNNVFSSMFDNYSDKLREFTDLKDVLEADKNLAIAENSKLLDRIEQLNKDLLNERKLLEIEKDKNKDLIISIKKETLALTSQLDDSRLMIEVLEKSKKLSMEEIAKFSEEIPKLKSKLNSFKNENLTLKTRLDESQANLEKAKKEKEELQNEIAALKLHILENHSQKTSRRKSSNLDVKEKQISVSSEVKESDLQQASVSLEVKESDLQQASVLLSEVKESELQQTVVPPEAKGNESSCKLQEETIQTDETQEDIEKLKNHCNELHVEIEKKNETILKLQEELLKTRGVVEYLSKERDSAQKNESQKQQALDECILRLNEAAELYKKQFRKIEKLKKKLGKNGSDFMISSVSTSVKDSNSAAESADESSNSSTTKLTQVHNSDSDTGEHVLRHPTEENVASAMNGLVRKNVISCSYASENMRPSCSKHREVPGLQTLIEMNLEDLKNSKSKEEDDNLYAIPCPICDQDVGVFMSSTDEMIKHLEMQHKQQVCPVCGRLFDMTLPPNYFVFHVEDHFDNGVKK